MFGKSAHCIAKSVLFRSSTRCFARQTGSSKVSIRQKGPSAGQAAEVKEVAPVQRAVGEKPERSEADTIADILFKYAIISDDGGVDTEATQK